MATRLADSHFVLFFTRGMSLKRWDEVGMLEREVEIYRRLRPHLGGIAFLTYGDESELRYAPQLDGIEILCNRWGLPTRIYARLAPLLYWRQMRGADIFKTNQTNGSEVALFAKRLFGARLVARCGYMWSYHAKRKAKAESSTAIELATRRERAAFSQADRVVLTAEFMKQYALDRYSLSEDKVWVIPNYVLTDLFIPTASHSHADRRIIFIGRLVEQKSPWALLDAMQGLDAELVVIGDGPLREPLEAKASAEGLAVKFLGNRPHRELPQHLNRATLFVLPSHYEGHPKTLLEAMSCGLPVIGTNVVGIRELIEHGQTGFLCGTSPADIRATILKVLGVAKLREKMGRQARQFVVENFSVERVLTRELALLDSLISES